MTLRPAQQRTWEIPWMPHSRLHHLWVRHYTIFSRVVIQMRSQHRRLTLRIHLGVASRTPLFRPSIGKPSFSCLLLGRPEIQPIALRSAFMMAYSGAGLMAYSGAGLMAGRGAGPMASSWPG